MKVTKRIGQGFKFLVNFPRWMGWDRIRDSAKQIGGMAKSITTVRQAKHQETFEEAIKRLNLSEEEITKQISRHIWMFSLYATLALAMFVYAFYLLFTQYYQGFILGIFVGILTSSLAFREHFYYFQMKTRQLGCTFQDWVDFVLRRAQK